jgi:hypothetical protein
VSRDRRQKTTPQAFLKSTSRLRISTTLRRSSDAVAFAKVGTVFPSALIFGHDHPEIGFTHQSQLETTGESEKLLSFTDAAMAVQRKLS